MSAAQCIWNSGCELGEGAFWSQLDQRIWFVDILGQAIHSCASDGSDRQSWQAPQRVGFALQAAKGMVVGLADGLYRWQAGQNFEPLHLVGCTPRDRLNDGTVGPDGAIWFGTKNEAEDAATGAWFRWSGGEALQQLGPACTVTNGPAFSPDGRRIYFSDSVDRRVFVRELDQGGNVGPEQTFVEIEDEAGYPDGLAVDDEGNLWVALWAGWSVRQYSASGRLLASVALPCANVTKPAFGGDDMRSLFITTAATGLSPAEHMEQPLAGGLFVVRTEARGTSTPVFR